MARILQLVASHNNCTSVVHEGMPPPTVPVDELVLYRKLRQEELYAYSALVRVFTAHSTHKCGEFSRQQNRILEDLRELLHVPEDRHVAELSAVVQDPLINAIAKNGVSLRRALFRDPDPTASHSIPGDVPTDTEVDLPVPKTRRPQSNPSAALSTSAIPVDQSPTTALPTPFLSPSAVASASEIQLLFERCGQEQQRAADLAQIAKTCPRDQRPAVMSTVRKQANLLRALDAKVQALPNQKAAQLVRPDALSLLLADIVASGPCVGIEGPGGALESLRIDSLLDSLAAHASKGGYTQPGVGGGVAPAAAPQSGVVPTQPQSTPTAVDSKEGILSSGTSNAPPIDAAAPPIPAATQSVM